MTTYGIAFLIILALNFFMPRMMPGDPLTAIYGDEALVAMTPALKANLVTRFALDQPLWHQFTAYIATLFRGDMGWSYFFNAPVLKVILGSLPWTLLGFAEPGILHRHEINHLAFRLRTERIDHDYSRCLRHRFDDQNARHDRMRREMALEIRFVDRDILDAGRAFTGN